MRKTTPTTTVKMAGLVLFALMPSLGVNLGCVKDQVHLGRNDELTSGPNATSVTRGGSGPASAPSGRTSAGGQKAAGSAHDPADYQVVTLDEVRGLFADPKTQSGQYVFVDARSDEAFEAGHVPGAVQCDYWHVGTRINAVLPRILGAEKVIVYCQVNDCEVGPGLCRALTQMVQVPWDTLYLFKGGWEEWAAAKLPIETGRVDKS
ncbi:MAG TPA: rhodanese-like domain-containing protein [Phycisphaerae bacterium]|nr:rhodanese-like domain-containing protein [Phycisphaerae bacterium]HRY68407.1 rhodanese-like domain-containing protein [Phycisphaerae bacterium]HSA27824.1 rhodanese-like domain-containing protein [Phycisphaerae bacterium]